jgi:hypothetical protein
MITPEDLIVKLGVGTDDAVCVQRLLDQIPAYQVRRDAAGRVIAGHVVPGHEVMDATGHVRLVPAQFVADPVSECVQRDAAGHRLGEHGPAPVPPQPAHPIQPPHPARPLPDADDDEKDDEPKPKKRG